MSEEYKFAIGNGKSKNQKDFEELILEALLEAEAEKLFQELLKPSQTKLVPKDKPKVSDPIKQQPFNIPQSVCIDVVNANKPHPIKKSKDMINHPPHYNFGKYECLDVIEDVLGKEGFKAYLKGNILKYLWRTDKKNGAEDLKKASFYLNRLISLNE